MEFSRLIDSDGRLRHWPMKKRAQRGAILEWLAQAIPAGRDLTEPEVNEAIKAKTAVMDHVYFRRLLIEVGLLQRTPYGDRYWRTVEERPERSLP